MFTWVDRQGEQYSLYHLPHQKEYRMNGMIAAANEVEEDEDFLMADDSDTQNARIVALNTALKMEDQNILGHSVSPEDFFSVAENLTNFILYGELPPSPEEENTSPGYLGSAD